MTKRAGRTYRGRLFLVEWDDAVSGDKQRALAELSDAALDALIADSEADEEVNGDG